MTTRMTAGEARAWNESRARQYDVLTYLDGLHPLLRRFERKRYEAVAVEAAPGAGLVLDAGCGPGLLLERLARAGGDAVGLELSAWNVARSRERGHGRRVIQGDLQRAPLRGGRFAAVACTEVIEHLPDVEKALAECARLLVPAGRLVISIPNERLIDTGKAWLGRLGILRLLWRVPGGTVRNAEDGWHLHSFSRDAFAERLRRSGFRVEKVRVMPSACLPLRWVFVAVKERAA